MRASVILLIWNGMAYLKPCLEALQAQTFADFDTIVVDNGSTDGSADYVASACPQAHLIRNARNLGFAAGNNQGLRDAGGDVLVLLNQDTIVRPDWLATLVGAVTGEPRRGIVGGKALYGDGRVQHAGGYLDPRGEGYHYGYRVRDEGQFEQLRDVDFVTGAALAISRAAFSAVGELDEGFGSAYYEDVDWCYRTRAAGFRVLYVPEAVLIHAEASTATDRTHEGMYRFHRNRLRFVLKNWPIAQLAEGFLPAELMWLQGLGEGSEQLIAAMHHVYLYHLLHLDELEAWRAKALGLTAGDQGDLARMLVTLRTTVPLTPALGSSGGTRGTDSVHKAWAQALEDLRQRQDPGQRAALSRVPLVGKLMAALGRLFRRRHQAEFNSRVVTMLQELMRANAVLAEYLVEDGREHGDLVEELRQLRTLLNKNLPH